MIKKTMKVLYFTYSKFLFFYEDDYIPSFKLVSSIEQIMQRFLVDKNHQIHEC